MQQQPSHHPNPFALLMHPETVHAALERSARLGSLNSRVYRPLDKPLIAARETEELAAFDAEVDSAGEAEA